MRVKGRTDRHTDRHEECSSRVSQFCERAQQKSLRFEHYVFYAFRVSHK